jgi:hypothetical protein
MTRSPHTHTLNARTLSLRCRCRCRCARCRPLRDLLPSLATPDDDEACRRFDDDDLDRDVLELALAPRGDVVADWWRGEAGDLRGE